MFKKLRFLFLLSIFSIYTGLVWAADEVHTATFAWALTELTGNGGDNPAIVTVPRFDDQGGARVLTQVKVEIRGDLTTGGDPNDNPPPENPPANTGYTTSGTLTNRAVQAQTFIFKLTAQLFQAEVLPDSPASLATVALLPTSTVLHQKTYVNVPPNGTVLWGPKTINGSTTTQTFDTSAALAQFVGSGNFGYSARTLIGQSLSGGGR